MTKVTINNTDIEQSEQLSDCARHHPKKLASLSEKQLNEEHKLPCDCESTGLKNLLGNYECSTCEEECYYCFCMKSVVDSESMWYCDDCGTCREDSEWHCPRCNKCTYGLTLKCDNCGKKSPYMS